jgi:hypothetical protein
MIAHRTASTLVVAVALVAASLGAASADISKKVQAAFKGQLLITAEPLPESLGDDKETIASYKKAVLKSVKGEPGDEEALTWHFNFTAFFKGPVGVDELSLDFYTNDKEKLYVANKKLSGIDKSMTVLTGDISIDENDNVNANRSYLVKLTGKVKGKEVTFASAPLATTK